MNFPKPKLSILVLFGLFVLLTDALHEDQVGKFDWHQKFIGPIRFVFNDPQQPKRLIVGAENNVIGALHGNNGNILYRQLLERGGKLLYYGLHDDRQTLAVSKQEGNIIKIRTFMTPTGIRIDEWVTQAAVTHVTVGKYKVYIIDAPNSATNSEITVNTFNLKGDGGLETKKVNLGLLKAEGKTGTCGVTGVYFICTKGNAIAVYNLEDGSLSMRKLTEDGDIVDLTTSGTGEIPAIALQGEGFSRAFILLVNSKSGPELLPLTIPQSTSKVVLSQFNSEERPLLFVSTLDSVHSIRLTAFNRNGQLVDGSSTKVTTSIPLSALITVQGYCVNSRYGLAGVTKDDLIFGTKADGSPASELEVEWSREESLSSIVAVEMVDYPSDVGPTWNPYLATLNVVSAFVSRIKYEVEAIITGESLYSSDEDRFGLRKVIVFATAVGKVVGMDSSSGNILYTFFLPDFSLFTDSTAFLYIQRPAKYTPLKPQATVIYQSASTKNAVLFAFNPVEGKPLDEPKTFPPILQTQMINHAGEDTQFVKPILLLDKNRNVHMYPAGRQVVKDSYFFVAKKGSSPQLQGFDINGSGEKLKAKLLWELNLSGSELLGVHGKLQTERVHSQGRVLPDRSVSYKYMNPNLVVVVTADSEVGNINLYLVDVVSGAVIHSFWHKKCRGPVHLVHSEHWIVYSLYSDKNRRYEVNSVELYEGQTQSNSTAFSSFAAPPVEPIVVKQSYIFPTAIQHLAYTRSEKGITNKDILIALPTGGVLELPRIILQPRVNQQHYTQQMQEEDGMIHSIPYVPELPMPSEMIFNYNQSVKRIDGIKTWPTRLESTCLVLVHGSDLYYTKLTPSKTFDVLKDDFDHWFITVVLVGLIMAAYGTKRLAARKVLDQAWR